MRVARTSRVNTSLLSVAIGLAVAGSAAAECNTYTPASGDVVVCTPAAPNPSPGVQGQPGATGVRVTIQPGTTIGASAARGPDWAIDNAGRMEAPSAIASPIVISMQGGRIDNRHGGLIGGGFIFNPTILSVGGAFEMTNAGTIFAGNGVSVSSDADSTITNLTGAGIAGFSVAVAMFGKGNHVLNNFGAISGDIAFGDGDDTLLLGTGSTIRHGRFPSSTIDGGSGRNTLALQGTGVSDERFTGFQQLAVRPDANWTLGGRFDARGALRVDVGTGALLLLRGVYVATSLEKLGAGALTLAGDASALAGANEVRAGALLVDGTLGGSVRVASGARLAGTGTVGTLSNEGVVDPGNAGPGQLRITGNYTHAAGATYRVDITPAGLSDTLVVTGQATLNDGTVDVVKVNGQYDRTTRYAILSATSGVVGRFSQMTQNMPFLNLFLSYDASNVFLNVGRSQTTFGEVCDATDACAVAGVFDAISTVVRDDNPLASVLDTLALQNVSDANNAFSTFSGGSYATLTDMLVQASTPMRMPLDASGAPPQRGFRIRAQDESGELSDGGRASWDMRGVALDFDAGVGENLWAGATLSTQRVDGSIGVDRADIDMDGIEGRIGWAGPRLQTALAIGRTNADMSLDRFPALSSTSATGSASSQRDASLVWVRGEVATRIDMGTWAVQPFIDVMHQQLESDAVSEDLSGLGLAGGVTDHRRTSSALGARASGSWQAQAWTIEPVAQLAWRHVLSDTGGDFVGSLSGAPTHTFSSRGFRATSDGWLAQLALTARRGPGFAGTLGYGLQRASDARVHGLHAALRWTW